MDETLKNRLLVAAFTFSIIVIIVQLFFNSPFQWSTMLIGILIASVAAGAAFGAMVALNK